MITIDSGGEGCGGSGEGVVLLVRVCMEGVVGGKETPPSLSSNFPSLTPPTLPHPKSSHQSGIKSKNAITKRKEDIPTDNPSPKGSYKIMQDDYRILSARH